MVSCRESKRVLHGKRVRDLGCQPYLPTWEAMRAFTERRTEETPDEYWLVEHPSVFTLGQSGDAGHILDARDIPVVACDRGGQVTYHGPGQLLVYVLVDLGRAGIGVRRLVWALEQSVIDLLASVSIVGQRRASAPGVYVEQKKIAALGIRVRRGRCYHGLALNVNMDLTPFSYINPCGYPDLEVSQLFELGIQWSVEETALRLLKHLAKTLVPK